MPGQIPLQEWPFHARTGESHLLFHLLSKVIHGQGFQGLRERPIGPTLPSPHPPSGSGVRPGCGGVRAGRTPLRVLFRARRLGSCVAPGQELVAELALLGPASGSQWPWLGSRRR